MNGSRWRRVLAWASCRWGHFLRWARNYFLAYDPTFVACIVPFYILAIVLYTRDPRTNFIFDEQEALLANPYVRAAATPHPAWPSHRGWTELVGLFGSYRGWFWHELLDWLTAFKRDFWGLLPDRSIGSYRPIPNIVWRALWRLSPRESPFLHHYFNIAVHSMNGTLVTLATFLVTKRRGASWLAGTIFVATAIVTEAVSGVVGLADVLGALGVLLALVSLVLPLWAMPVAVALSVAFGLFSKESALCAVPLIPLAALLCSRDTHPRRPLAPLRALFALGASGGAFYAYVELRRRWFPAAVPPEISVEAVQGKGLAARAFAGILRWYAQPTLPRDPLNNPLAPAHGALRIAGALRVYWRGLLQVVSPWPLSGDYSAPQEPLPDRAVFLESILGALFFAGPLLLATVFALLAWRKRRRAIQRGETPSRDLFPIVALCMVWVVFSYFPVSNIPVALPTVRAERFWYFPVIATSVLLGLLFAEGSGWTLRRWKRRVWAGAAAAFIATQCLCARIHANDYRDDLVFWDATRHAARRSAKAHLNYSVMLGARGDLEGRLASSRVALDLAPAWPMASIYLGDTLCRLHRAAEAVPHYKRGFELGPNDQHLIALAIQCLWDENAMGENTEVRGSLSELADEHEGSWLAFLVRDTIEHGEEHKGVDPKYRPRGYNEGPKKD